MAAAFIWAAAAVVARILAAVMSVEAELSTEAARVLAEEAVISAERMLEAHAISAVCANSMEAAMSEFLARSQGRVALAMPAAPSTVGFGMLRALRRSAQGSLQRQTARHG